MYLFIAIYIYDNFIETIKKLSVNKSDTLLFRSSLSKFHSKSACAYTRKYTFSAGPDNAFQQEKVLVSHSANFNWIITLALNLLLQEFPYENLNYFAIMKQSLYCSTFLYTIWDRLVSKHKLTSKKVIYHLCLHHFTLKSNLFQNLLSVFLRQSGSSKKNVKFS